MRKFTPHERKYANNALWDVWWVTLRRDANIRKAVASVFCKQLFGSEEKTKIARKINRDPGQVARLMSGQYSFSLADIPALKFLFGEEFVETLLPADKWITQVILSLAEDFGFADQISESDAMIHYLYHLLSVRNSSGHPHDETVAKIHETCDRQEIAELGTKEETKHSITETAVVIGKILERTVLLSEEIKRQKKENGRRVVKEKTSIKSQSASLRR